MRLGAVERIADASDGERRLHDETEAAGAVSPCSDDREFAVVNQLPDAPGGHETTKDDFEVTARDIGVSAVPFHSSEWRTMQEFVDFARVVQGKEGFVIKFEGNEFYKIKGDDYVLKHKSKDATSLEKNVLAMVINDALDDVLPLLDPEYRAKVEDYAAEVREGVAETAMMIGGFVEALAHVDQKTFAVKHVSGFTQPVHKALAFQVRAGKEPLAAVKQAILKNTGSQPDVDAVRHLFGAWWEA